MSLVCATSACSIKAAGSVAQPTALELQLLGAYRELDDDIVRVSSFRAGSTVADREQLAQKAMDARAMQRFNEDDLFELKQAGCLAEGLDARVMTHPCSLSATDPAVERRRRRVIDQENRARRALLEWATAALAYRSGRSSASAELSREVRSAYVRLLRQAARPGELFETSPGRFDPWRGE
ncbi:MAG: hypothetical protein AAF449_04980 [Myxococcota bacterium]